MGPVATSTIAIGPNSTCVRALASTSAHVQQHLSRFVAAICVRLRRNEVSCSQRRLAPKTCLVSEYLAQALLDLSPASAVHDRVRWWVWCVVAPRAATDRWHARHCRQEYHRRVTAANPGQTVADHGGGVEDASNAEFKIIAAEPDGWSRRGPRAPQALCSNWPASDASGSGAQGRAPHPDSNAKLQAHGPRSSRQLGGGMPRHKLAWSRDGGDPKSLAHSFYRRAAARLDSMCTTWPGCCHVPWRQLHPSNPPEVPEYVPAYLPTQLGKKKRGPVLGGGLERGGRGITVIYQRKLSRSQEDFLRAGYWNRS